MLPKDVLARVIEFPKDFPNDVLDAENFFQFRQADKSVDFHAMSVVSRFMLSEAHSVHAYGEFVVTAKNDRYRKDKGADPNPLKKYIGFYELFAEAFMFAATDCYIRQIKWRPENGQEAHFQLEIIGFGPESPRIRKDVRRKLRQSLFDSAFGPVVSEAAKSDATLNSALSALPVKVRSL